MPTEDAKANPQISFGFAKPNQANGLALEGGEEVVELGDYCFDFGLGGGIGDGEV